MVRNLIVTALALVLALLAWLLLRDGATPAEVVPASAGPAADLTAPEPAPAPAVEAQAAARETVEGSADVSEDTPAEAEAVLAVLVLAREDGTPLEGVELHVRPRPTNGVRPRTGEDGRVEIHVPAGQELEVDVFPELGFHGPGSLTQPALAPGGLAEVALALPTRGDAVFHARLVDAESGEPIRQALIHSPLGRSSSRAHEGHERGPGLTPVDGEGRFFLEYGTWDNVQLCVHAPGWSLALVHPSAGHETPQSEQLVPLLRAAQLTLDVLDAAGRAQAGLSVEVSARGFDLLRHEGLLPRFGTPDPTWSSVTGTDGRAVLAGLPARAGLTLAVWRGREVLRTQDLGQLEPGEDRALELRLGAGVKVSGEAVEADGAPLPDVEVWLVEGAAEAYLDPRFSEPRARTRTDAQGRFLFEPVRAGSWSVGLAPQGADVPPERLISTVSTPVSVAEEDVDVRLVAHRGLVVEGTVVDAAGQGVQGLSVVARSRLPRGRLGARTGDDGRFLIGGLAPGELELTASTPGSGGAFAPSDSVTVQAGQRGVVLRVEAAASLAGRLVSGAGGPPGDVDILVCRSDGALPVEGLSMLRLNGDRFQIGGLAAGAWGIGVTTRDGRVGALGGIALAPGQSRDDLVVRLEPGAELRVRDGLGEALAGSTISVHVDGACLGWNGTVPGGTVSFHVPGGRLRVVAVRDNRVVRELDVDVLAGEVAEVVLE